MASKENGQPHRWPFSFAASLQQQGITFETEVLSRERIGATLEVAEHLQIKEGDHVIIIGREILKIDGYARNGNYLGYWQDSGCNTTLITEVYINP